MRPLISTGDPKKSVDISRKAELYETSSGMVTITGGKLTTWRRMAKMAVDRIVEREGREAPCRTHEIPLGMSAEPDELEAFGPVGEDSRDHLAGRYGHAAVEVLEIAQSSPELAGRPSPDLPDLVAEAAFAARREQARSLADVMLRRTRLGLLDARRLTDGAVARARRRWRARWRRSWAGTTPRWRRRSTPGTGSRASRASCRARRSPYEADGHRQRDAGLVLGPAGPEGPGRAGGARACGW